MPLTSDDIERIEDLGFDRDFFVAKRDGWLRLRNVDGRCVFHDGDRCRIYDGRPEGCRLYPIVYDETGGLEVPDRDCPHREKFRVSRVVAQRVANIVKTLERERAVRERRPTTFSSQTHQRHQIAINL